MRACILRSALADIAVPCSCRFGMTAVERMTRGGVVRKSIARNCSCLFCHARRTSPMSACDVALHFADQELYVGASETAASMFIDILRSPPLSPVSQLRMGLGTSAPRR